MKLTWLGHSAFRLEIGTAVILIDPFLSGNATFTGTVAEASAGCTHVVLSHGHDDHVGDTVEICRANNAQLVGCFELCMVLSSKGVEDFNPANTGGTIDCGAFKVTFTQAHHSSGTVVDGNGVYLGVANGLVFEGDFPTIYHMGDTSMFGDMAMIHEFHQPKIGLVPIGDRFTMGGRQAAVACRRFFDFDTIIPIHYGTFPIIDQTPDLFVREMGEDAGKVTVAEVGHAMTL